MTAVERFMSRVQVSPGCWLWQGELTEKGYGRLVVDGRRHRAHRLSYEIFVGAIPAGMLVCHRCDTPGCVRPSHLFAGSPSDNSRDMWVKGRGVGRSRLDRDDAAEVRRAVMAGEPKKAIARRLGVAPKTVRDIAQGRTWKIGE